MYTRIGAVHYGAKMQEEETYRELYDSLLKWFTSHSKVWVAFSGGCDSSLLLHSACESLTVDNVVAVTADSPSFGRSEFKSSRDLASNLGVRHLIVETDELDDVNYYSNGPDRCYFCKYKFYSTLFERIRSEGEEDTLTIVDGNNLDDLSDIRPGLRAAEEFGILHPFVELGFSKKMIRDISRYNGLSTADKPEMACLSSRISTGIVITKKKLKMVERAEEVIVERGFIGARVRYHEIARVGCGDAKLILARIECDDLVVNYPSSSNYLQSINSSLREIGFDYVTLDLGGYKKGGRT